MSGAYAHLGREPRKPRDHTQLWRRLTPIADAKPEVRAAIERFCERKRITFDALEKLRPRVVWRGDAGYCLAFAGLNDARTAVVAIKYRPLEGSSHDSFAEKPSIWLRPLVAGNRNSLDWLVAEGETDAARLCGLVGDDCAILVLPSGAATFKEDWAKRIPRGATVALCHDADQDGDEGAAKAARVIGGRTVRVRPPAEGGDWCDWDGDRQAFVQLLQQASSSSSTTGGLRVLDIETMLTTPPPPVPWVVQPILARGCVTMLAGREGRGKSMLALALAAAVGRATFLADIAGMPVGLSGHVVYIDAENGANEAHRRVHGLSVAPGSITYVEASGFDLKQHLGNLELLVRRCDPKLLVLDSLRSLAPGLDENDSMQAEQVLRPVVRLTQQLHIATLVLHHASRMSGEYRGSTAIGAAVELGFTLSRVEDDPMAATRRKLACWKSRPAAEPEPRWLTIKPDSDGDIILSEAAPYEAPRRTPKQDEIEEALQGLIRGGVGCGVPIGGDHTTPPSWTTADFARHVERDPRDWSVRQAVKRLEDANLIHRNGNDRWQRSESLLDGADG